MKVRRVKKNFTHLGKVSERLDAPEVRCDPAAPFPDAARLEHLANYLHIYTCGDAWMAVRDDGVIKWIVADPDDFEPGGPVALIIDHIYATHGTARGRVLNPVLRGRFKKLGHRVDNETGWVTYKESP